MNKSRAASVLVLVFGVIVIAAMAVAIWQQSFAMRQAMIAVEDRKLDLQEAEARLVRLSGLKSRADELDVMSKQLKCLVPATAGEDDLIVLVQSVADLAGMKLVFIRFETRKDVDGVLEMPFRIGLEGSYQGLICALEHFEMAERAIRVDELLIAPLDSEDPDDEDEIEAVSVDEIEEMNDRVVLSILVRATAFVME